MKDRAGAGIGVHSLASALVRVTGMRATTSVALRHMVRAVGSRYGTLAVAEPDGTLETHAIHGYRYERRGPRVAPDHGAMGVVLKTGLPLVVADVTAAPHLRRPRSRYRTNSFVAVPIIAGDTVLGVVCLTDPRRRSAFSDEDAGVLQALAAPVALAIARERAREDASRFASAAMEDPLTGLFNRRYFLERLEEELHRAGRHERRLMLMLIDIDDFKAINDRCGHFAGDAIIRGVAGALRRSVRKCDVCIRYGGDEFAVLMPGSSAVAAAGAGERIRRSIRRMASHEPRAAGVRLTISIGVSSACNASPRDLIQRADDSLSEAKRLGKNRVVKS